MVADASDAAATNIDTIIFLYMVLLSSSVIKTSAGPTATRGYKTSMGGVWKRILGYGDEREAVVRMTFSKYTEHAMFIGCFIPVRRHRPYLEPNPSALFTSPQTCQKRNREVTA